MELTLDGCNSVTEKKMLEQACDRVDGARVMFSKNAPILVADTEDTVWNVWRVFEDVDEDNSEAVEAAENVQSTLEAMFE